MTAAVDHSSSGALDKLFGALSDPTRRQLVEQLLTNGPASATQLAQNPAQTGQRTLTRQAVLKHLQVLDSAGLLSRERVGREVRYRVTPEPLTSAVTWILATAGDWDRRLERLRTLGGRRS